MSAVRRHPEEAGSAIVEFVWLTILLLVPLIYVVLTVFTAQRAAYAASTAARGAVRAFLAANDPATAESRARTAVRIAFDDQGLPGPVEVTIGCRSPAASCLAPGAVVRIRVRARVPLPLLPAGLFRTPAVTVSSEQVAPYGEHRQARSR
jgi:hypothetical protein